MLLDKFEVGKRYRFNKEIYSSYMESMGWSNSNSWNVLIHLQEVTTIDDSYGYIECYLISPEWCEEIITEPLITRDDIKVMYEQLLYLEELEETLDAMDEYMTTSHMYSNFIEFIKSEIERVIDELGLEE
ncbi:MAG TPA: hypothetical protein VFC79_07195 [Tissierellaceae bacterium]|nr:hypothetical protein [Tissierellaceae bacterium]